MNADPDTLVLGNGVSGQAAVRLLKAMGRKVVMLDGSDTLPEGEIAEAIVSPGIPWDHPWQEELRGRGVHCVSELEFGWRHRPADTEVWAVTGSLGKSTVVHTAVQVLQDLGIPARPGGNYGIPVSQLAFESLSGSEKEGTDAEYTEATERVSSEAKQVAEIARFSSKAAPEAERRQMRQVWVLEVSSFQLETCHHFAPDAALLLNLVPNHLDRHGTMQEYRRMKLKLFAKMRSRAPRILPTGFEGADFQYVSFGEAGASDVNVGVKKDRLFIDHSVTVWKESASTSRTKGLFSDPIDLRGSMFEHSPLNCNAAGLVALLITSAIKWQTGISGLPSSGNPAGSDGSARSASKTASENSLFSFLPLESPLENRGAPFSSRLSEILRRAEPLPHRLQPVGEINGVRYINDSKSTCLEATRAAIRMMDPTSPHRLHLLLGGRPKEKNVQSLKDVLAMTNGAVYYFGEFGLWVAQKGMTTDGASQVFPDLISALEACCNSQTPGDVVLLSPGCASYDQFKSFEERGAVFSAWVESRSGGKEHPTSGKKHDENQEK